MWTFGRKIAAGFGLAFALLLLVGAVSYRAIDSLAATSYQVAHTHQVLEHIAGALGLLRDMETGQRGFVITGEDSYLEPYERANADLTRTFKELRELTADNPHQQRRLDEAEPLMATKVAELKRSIAIRRSGGFEAAQKVVQTNEGKKAMDDLRGIFLQMEREERDLLKVRSDDVESAARGTRTTILGGTVVCLLLILFAGYLIVTSLTTQIGSAVKHMQSSSSELQAAAGQQVAGSKEQATAMAEITTTINELLATSRQIADSAQRVAQMAGEAVTAAEAGGGTVTRTHESVTSIKRSVDNVVVHMLELGRKSQQIGGILEIINELAEQTNILAINATIEAAGAGDSGKRFGVVADEIRKLADRVGGSTKEIRKLVDDIRAAVNTTVMATETGSKAVDAGSRQFDDVATSFTKIVGLVSTTTEAAREIELSTKQQATAVEQVNVAVANVSQASRENEASSTQTLQTSSQLATLARDLGQLVQASAT